MCSQGAGPPSPPPRGIRHLPEASTISEEELRSIAAGGASLLNHGQLGASVDSMGDFWRARVPEPLANSLAERAISHGGIWADPLTLEHRLEDISRMIKDLPLTRLMKRYPGVVEMRPETHRLKIEALADVLPGVDVLTMVSRRPTCAGRPMHRRHEPRARRLRLLARPLDRLPARDARRAR